VRKRADVVLLVLAAGLVWFMILLASEYSVVDLRRNADSRLIFSLVLLALFAGLVTDATEAPLHSRVDYAFALFSTEGFIRRRHRTKNPSTAP